MSLPVREESRYSRIIAVDPGTTITGYGVLENRKGEFTVLNAGVIRNPPQAKPARKLIRIHRRLSQLIDQYLPRALILEDVFYHKNIKTLLKLGEVRGVCILLAAQKGIPVFSYAARRVKQAVVGRGGADKTQVQKMIQILLKLEEPPSPLDISDALALGVTFFQDRMKEV